MMVDRKKLATLNLTHVQVADIGYSELHVLAILHMCHIYFTPKNKTKPTLSNAITTINITSS